MAAYQIHYYDNEEALLKSETVFMKGIRAAKQSATMTAPEHTVRTIILDVVGRPLLTKELGQWTEHES
ncbi:hypothetical protein AB4472_09215 [Vibrio lentus]